jgi:hypothetical protein
MSDTTIQYQPGAHKGQPVIWIRFPYHAALTNTVKQLPGCRWSQSNKSWYVPDTGRIGSGLGWMHNQRLLHNWIVIVALSLGPPQAKRYKP